MTLATDAQGNPVVVVHHRAERGVGSRDGQWAVTRVERTLTQTGDVAAVNRSVVGWFPTQDMARFECALFDAESARERTAGE